MKKNNCSAKENTKKKKNKKKENENNLNGIEMWSQNKIKSESAEHRLINVKSEE